jgi:hypothetical protein
VAVFPTVICCHFGHTMPASSNKGLHALYNKVSDTIELIFS